MLNPDYIAWTRRTLDSLNINGVWGIPRSQVVVKKLGPATVEILNDTENQEIQLRAYIVAAGYAIKLEDGQQRLPHQQN